MSTRYRHTQIGTLTIVSLGTGILLGAFPMALYGAHWIPVSVLIILAIALGLFATLTVEIAESSLVVRFGPGVIRKEFSLAEIASCQGVRNPWYYGWGIRLTPHGWLYNVSGCLAVELQMKSGKKYRIGTDDPEGLVRAIRQAGVAGKGGPT